MRNKVTKVVSIILAGVVVASTLCGCGTESFQRAIKSTKSNFTGGLERTVTVYDYNGEAIKSWSGKFDVSESENEVYFDLDGKRIIIHGGIIINEEN